LKKPFLIFCTALFITVGLGLFMFWPVDPVDRVIVASRACLMSLERGQPLQIVGYEPAMEQHVTVVMGQVYEMKRPRSLNVIYWKTRDDRVIIIEEEGRGRDALKSWRSCTIQTRISGYTKEQFESLTAQFSIMKKTLMAGGNYKHMDIDLGLSNGSRIAGFQSTTPNSRGCIVAAYMFIFKDTDSITIKYGEQTKSDQCGIVNNSS
jgi:hypothetical protein